MTEKKRNIKTRGKNLLVEGKSSYVQSIADLLDRNEQLHVKIHEDLVKVKIHLI